jgi:hypothetical protein
MKISKVFFILLFPLIAEMIVSCCDCAEPEHFRYTNSELAVSNLDNSGQFPEESNTPEIIKSAYGIRVRVLTELACLEKKRSFIIGNAYATSCDCEPGLQFHPKDSVTGIKVFSLNDFDSLHSAGSDISAYFMVYKLYRFSDISDHLDKDDPSFYDDQERLKALDLLLITAPSTGTQHRFAVEVHLSDGRILKKQTPAVELK